MLLEGSTSSPVKCFLRPLSALSDSQNCPPPPPSTNILQAQLTYRNMMDKESLETLFDKRIFPRGLANIPEVRINFVFYSRSKCELIKTLLKNKQQEEELTFRPYGSGCTTMVPGKKSKFSQN